MPNSHSGQSWNGDEMYTMPEPCKKCGQLHWRELKGRSERTDKRNRSRGVDDMENPGRRTCVGHRTNGSPCRKWPYRGTTVCEVHGASAPQVRAKADAKYEYWDQMKRVTQGLTSAGVKLEQPDPIRELLWAVATSSHAVKWLGYKVAELVAPDVTSDPGMRNVIGVDEDGNPRQPSFDQMLYYADENQVFRTHPLWREWNAERQRHARFAKLAVDAGVSERMIRIAEAQSEIIVETMLYALDQLSLGAELKERAVDIIAARFREVESHMAPLGIDPLR